jgi:hypothetical protein
MFHGRIPVSDMLSMTTPCHRCILALLLFFSFTSVMVSQVKIKEKITIAPKHLRSVNSGNFLRVEFSYAGTILSYNPNNPTQTYDNTFRIVNNFTCHVDQSVDVTGGSGSLTVTASGGGYDISAGLHIQGGGVATFGFYLDDQLIGSEIDTVSCADLCTLLLIPHVNLYAGLALTVSSSAIQPNGSNTLHLVSSLELCQSPVFVATIDTITLTITTGGTYGALLAPDGTQGQSVGVLAHDLADVQFIGNCTQPPSGPVTITVDATVRNISREITFQVVPTPPISRLLVTPVTSVNTGDSVRLFVTAVDTSGNEVICDDNRAITLTIDLTQYGKFITSGGVRVPSPLIWCI